MTPQNIADIITGINFVSGDSIPALTGSFLFNTRKFENRRNRYKELLSDPHNTIASICGELNIDFDTFKIEVPVIASTTPVCLKFIDSEVKIDLQKQKQIDAINYLKSKNKTLTPELLCEHLYMDVKSAKSIAKSANVKLCKKTKLEDYKEEDFLTDFKLQRNIISWFNKNPNTYAKDAKKALKLSIPLDTLRKGIKSLIDNGHRIPCLSNHDPIQIEINRKKIIKMKFKDIFATPEFIANELGLSVRLVQDTLEETALNLKTQVRDGYEFFFKKTFDETEAVKVNCLHRASEPKASSRWNEIALIAMEKQIKLLGLNPPSEVRIDQQLSIKTKQEKDEIIDAYFATDDIIDIGNNSKRTKLLGDLEDESEY